MVPNLSPVGYSFKGAYEYYAHDTPGEDHELVMTSERVAWTATRNLMTDDPKVATRIMIATALSADQLKAQAGIRNTGRKSAAHVQTLSLSWHPDENVTRAEMEQAADEVMHLLEVQDRQVVIWAHSDTAHPHIHLVINRVCLNTGKMAGLSNARYKLDQWAREYEQRRGLIVTPKRVEKFERREAARKTFTPEQRKAYVEARRKDVADTRQRPDNDRWLQARKAEARRALDDLEAAMTQKDAAEADLCAAALLLETAKGTQGTHTYSFTRRTVAERQALEAEALSAENEDWALVPPYPADEEAADAFALRLRQHQQHVEGLAEQTTSWFTEALPSRMSSLDGLRAIFTDLRAAAVTFGARLRDTLRGLAVDYLASLGTTRVAELRRETSRLKADLRRIDMQAAAITAERAALQAESDAVPKPVARPQGPTFGL